MSPVDRVYLFIMVLILTIVSLLGIRVYRQFHAEPVLIQRSAVPTKKLKRLQRYHGTIALEILPNGQVSIWRDGKWIIVQKGEEE